MRFLFLSLSLALSACGKSNSGPAPAGALSCAQYKEAYQIQDPADGQFHLSLISLCSDQKYHVTVLLMPDAKYFEAPELTVMLYDANGNTTITKFTGQ